MRSIRGQWFSAGLAVVAAGVAFVAMTVVAPRAQAETLTFEPAADITLASGPVSEPSFTVAPAARVRFSSEALPSAESAVLGGPAGPLVAPVAFGGLGSPGAGDGLYVDWVSPLQPPSFDEGGASARPTPEPVPGQTSGLRADPERAFVARADAGHAPAPIPEPHTLALLAVALLPLTAPLMRRRRP